MSGTDDSPNSEQSTMTKIPSSSHWHGDGHSGVAGPCLSWIRPYPQAPGADPQTPPGAQRSRSTDNMSDCPPVCIYTYRLSCPVTLSIALFDVSSLSKYSSPFSLQKPLTAFFFCADFPHCKSVPISSSTSSSLCSICLFLNHHFIPRG